ncbi:MAG: hypothetical protein V4594_23740 [Bacteroidota bacterium]
MKTNHLFTSILALAAVVATSCSAPRVAQQSTNDDDVYNTTAKAKVYTPAPVKPSQNTANTSDTYTDEDYAESDYYGTSDPYYDMDYSSRINRFYYASPFRSYYDPYFYSGWSVGIGYSPFYNSYWNSPYSGWGNAYSPFWGYNNFGWNNYYYGGGYYGGGFLGGGFLGGGYYGGGFYTGRTTNVPDYRSRPATGRDNGVGSYRSGYGRNATSGVTRSDANGRVVSRQRRAEEYDANGNSTTNTNRTSNARPARTQNDAPARPTRTESNAPARQPEARPTYTPPARSDAGSGSRGSSSGSSSSGSSSGSRPTRAGRG